MNSAEVAGTDLSAWDARQEVNLPGWPRRVSVCLSWTTRAWILTLPSGLACRWTPDASVLTALMLRFFAISFDPRGSRCKSVQNPIECSSHAGARAGGASAAGLAARQIFWRGALPGPEAHHAHARTPYGLRERALPQHGRVLGAWHGDVHDSRGYLHARLRVLRGAFGQAGWTAG